MDHHRWKQLAGVERTADRAAGIALSIVTLPILVVVVPLIWLTMGFPAVFKQRRIGANNKEFTIYKFRTMETQSSQESDVIWTVTEVLTKLAICPRSVTIGAMVKL